jgi:5-methylcytosine-specific restriction protein A
MPHIPESKRPYWNKKQVRPPHAKHTFINPWYHTTTWRKLRMSVLQDNPLCVHCLDKGVSKAARVVDHIKQVSKGITPAEREALMWDINNLQPLCDTCHNIKSAKERIL